MSVLPALTAREVIRKLVRAGFRFIYAKGSHYFFHNSISNRITSVPVHSGKNIGRGLLRKILKQAGITVKEFIKL
ncbi:MAG: type II toxin-antitoxin system HicA family toxin [Candidatus Taylorbacteria bacterium]|nr:type II toxin-antitoxin system HicA family toxin [Candidatus Taylorbacteria bacterium]